MLILFLNSNAVKTEKIWTKKAMLRKMAIRDISPLEKSLLIIFTVILAILPRLLIRNEETINRHGECVET